MDGTLEQRLARLAEGSHGVVTRAQLLRAGISASAIDRRVRRGALIAVHRGVYRVGHCAPNMEATYLAAVMACGEGALLCGLSAGFLLRLIKRRSPPRPEVMAPVARRVPGVRTRRARRGLGADAIAYRGVPVTSVARTLVDLAGMLGAGPLARAVHEAGVIHRATPAQVKAVLEQRPTSPGAANVRAVMLGDVRVSLSRLESRFLELLRAAGLPLPITNRVAGSHRVDCRWPEYALTVELDSYRFHNSRHSWEQGHRRRREARARGDQFRRFSWGDVFEDPALMMAELRELLGA